MKPELPRRGSLTGKWLEREGNLAKPWEPQRGHETLQTKDQAAMLVLLPPAEPRSGLRRAGVRGGSRGEKLAHLWPWPISPRRPSGLACSHSSCPLPSRTPPPPPRPFQLLPLTIMGCCSQQGSACQELGGPVVEQISGKGAKSGIQTLC